MRLVTSSPRIDADERGLRATEIAVGILFNFGPKAEFRRYLFDNEKKIR